MGSDRQRKRYLKKKHGKNSAPDKIHTPQRSHTQSQQDHIMYLQRTIGNQATHNLYRKNVEQADIQRLSVQNTRWKKAKFAYKRGGAEGVNPIIFMESKSGTVVLKGDNGGAKQQFASDVYTGLVEAPDTRVVMTASTEGQKIISTLQKLRKKGKTEHLPNTTIEIMSGKQSIVIMEPKNLTTIERFASELEPNKTPETGNASFDSLISRMFRGGFFHQLGRITAADLFLGNHDRMEEGRIQVQNMFMDIDTGSALGMDLDIQAVGFEELQEKVGGKRVRPEGGGRAQFFSNQAIEGNEYKDWVTYALEGNTGEREVQMAEEAGGGTTTQEMKGIMTGYMRSTDFTPLTDEGAQEQLIDDLRAQMNMMFKRYIDNKVQGDAQEAQRRYDEINSDEMEDRWDRAKRNFKAGITEGMAHISEKMQNGEYQQMYDDTAANLGESEGFNFMTLQIRERYYRAKQEYPNLSEKKLRQMMVLYAKHIHTGEGNDPLEDNEFLRMAERPRQRANFLGSRGK